MIQAAFCFSKRQHETLYSPCKSPTILLLLLCQETKADWGELDTPSVSRSSLPPLIPRFPPLLRHFSAKVRSGLVSLLDTQTHRERGWRTWTHTHSVSTLPAQNSTFYRSGLTTIRPCWRRAADWSWRRTFTNTKSPQSINCSDQWDFSFFKILKKTWKGNSGIFKTWA